MGPSADSRGLGDGSISRPKRWGPWRNPSKLGFGFGFVAGPKGIGGRTVSGPKGIRGRVIVHTQMGWGMGPFLDSRGLGIGSFYVRTQEESRFGSMAGPKGVGDRVVSELKGVRDGVVSKPKRVGLWFFWCQDPMGLGFGVWVLSCPDLKALGFRSFCVQTQRGWFLGPLMARPKRSGLGLLTQYKRVHVRTQCTSQQTRWPRRATRLAGLAPVPGVHSLEHNLSLLQPWKSLWVGITIVAPSVCT